MGFHASIIEPQRASRLLPARAAGRMSTPRATTRSRFSIAVALALASASLLVALAATPAGARAGDLEPYSIDETLDALAPSDVGVAVEPTHFSDPTMGLTLYSWDPANPGTHNVTFTKEGESEDAVVYVAWDDLCTDFGRCDVLTDEQIAYYLATFQSSIYDQMQPVFGSPEPRPASDADGHKIAILIYNIRDESYYDAAFTSYIAGFFWGGLNEELQMNAVFIDSYDWANRLGPDARRPYLYEGTLAHEFQHLLHHDQDGDEDSFIDEGLADLAAYLTGFGHSSGHIAYYLVYHRDSLTHWGGSLVDYGAGYLWALYLFEKFGGEDFVRDLVQEQANGMEGVQKVLHARGYHVAVEDVFRDWTIANLVDDPALGPQYAYSTLAIGSEDTWGYTIQWSIKHAYGTDYHGKLPPARKDPKIPASDTVSPWAANYQSAQGANARKLAVSFDGADLAGVAPAGGSWEWWSGNANELFNTLSRDVAIGSGASLTFDAWYAIEQDWDYAYLQVYHGGTWMSVPGAITTSYDPNGQNLGNGITGFSGGWRTVTFDLSAHAGATALRFLYDTDAAVTETGMFLDNLVLSDAGGTIFSDDVEAGAGGWTSAGWERTTGLVDNSFGLRYVLPTASGRVVGSIALDPASEAGGATIDSTKATGRSPLYFVVTNTPDPVRGTFDARYALRYQPA